MKLHGSGPGARSRLRLACCVVWAASVGQTVSRRLRSSDGPRLRTKPVILGRNSFASRVNLFARSLRIAARSSSSPPGSGDASNRLSAAPADEEQDGDDARR